MKRTATAFVPLDQVPTYVATGWAVMPEERRKGLGGTWESLMSAPHREPAWFRLRRRLGFASKVR